MAKSPKSGKIALPPNLSFRRSIDVSDGLLSSVLPDGSLIPVIVEQITVRGAMGNSTAGYDKAGNPLSAEAMEKAQNPQTPNIQSIDRANLLAESDTLDLAFSVGFHGGGQAPDACSKPEYRSALRSFLDAAGESGCYQDLAARYLWNIVNGRVLWRNGFGAAAGATVSVFGGATIQFDWGQLRHRDSFVGVAGLVDAAVGAQAKADVPHLIESIASALRGVNDLVALDVSIRVRLYRGAEVWPSQEFVEESQKKRGGRDISRVLASRAARVGGEPVRQGVMHSQKIGNAIRTVDEWHGSPDFGAIPVEAFGWIQRELTAIRSPGNKDSGLDAYRALEAVGNTAAELLSGSKEAMALALYTLAIIIRGGVWGIKDTASAE